MNLHGAIYKNYGGGYSSIWNEGNKALSPYADSSDSHNIREQASAMYLVQFLVMCDIYLAVSRKLIKFAYE